MCTSPWSAKSTQCARMTATKLFSAACSSPPNAPEIARNADGSPIVARGGARVAGIGSTLGMAALRVHVRRGHVECDPPRVSGDGRRPLERARLEIGVGCLLTGTHGVG